MADDSYVLPSEADWDRLGRVAVRVESEMSGISEELHDLYSNPHHDIVVRVTGSRIEITTTTTTTTTTTNTDTTTSTTTSSSTGTTTTTTPEPKYVYPGVAIFRRFEKTEEDQWWEEDVYDVYIQEVNNESLVLEKNYSGAHFIGVYDGRGVFAVNAGGGAGSCADDPGDPPEDWTSIGPLCSFDLIEVRCIEETEENEYRRVRIHIVNGQFLIWTGPWGSENPPADP